jgi:hypothetical protein
MKLWGADMRYFTILAFMLASGVFASSQGPCTEAAVKEGNLPMAEGAFSHVPSFAKPDGVDGHPNHERDRRAGRSQGAPVPGKPCKTSGGRNLRNALRIRVAVLHVARTKKAAELDAKLKI